MGRLWKNGFGVHFDGLFGPPGGPWKIDLEARTVDFVRDASNETARMTILDQALGRILESQFVRISKA